jgi:hypothetical protein
MRRSTSHGFSFCHWKNFLGCRQNIGTGTNAPIVCNAKRSIERCGSVFSYGMTWLLAQTLSLSLAYSQTTHSSRSVPICSGVTLSANYLASVDSDRSPGFRFTLSNKTDRAISLAEPIPSSSHWYARSHGRWLWRASSGAGGSLLNAVNEHGRVIVYDTAALAGDPEVVTVAPHQSRVWIASQQQNPVLAYTPGCAQCSYPGERQYQVVFAYAYLAGQQGPNGLLSCGLRSVPVPMPPKF